MKFLCPACERLSELTAFRVDAGALVVRCDRCGEESRADAAVSGTAQTGTSAAPGSTRVVPLRAVELPENATSGENPFEAPEGFCPKCVAPRASGASTCSACGLLYVNYVAEPPRPELGESWREVLTAWSDSSVHDAFLGRAAALGELASAGRLYRIQLAKRPSDPMAARGREEVIRRAAAASFVMSADAHPAVEAGPDRRKQLAVAVMALIVIVLCFALIRTVSGLG